MNRKMPPVHPALPPMSKLPLNAPQNLGNLVFKQDTVQTNTESVQCISTANSKKVKGRGRGRERGRKNGRGKGKGKG